MTSCRTAIIPNATSVEAGATLAGSWKDRCDGKTANGCAAEHYANPSMTTVPGTGNLNLIFPTTTKKCANGTKPVVYVGNGSGSGTNKWVFWFNGGSGKCAKKMDRNNDTFTTLGENCYAVYSDPNAESGFLQKTAANYDGILDDNCTDNPDFCNWNRVHIVGCNHDQYQGVLQHAAATVTVANGHTYKAVVNSQGALVAKDALLHMTSAAGYNDFNNATTVVLAGSSGGAHGLVMTLDSLAAYADTLVTDPMAKIVGLADANVEAALEVSESSFDGGARCSSIFDDDCGVEFQVPAQGTDTAGFLFDNSAYRPHALGYRFGSAYEKNTSWGSELDGSCEAVHAADGPLCHDPYHVAHNHLDTPVFFAGSLRDTNQANNPIEYLNNQQLDTCWSEIGFQSGTGSTKQEEHTRGQLTKYALNRDNPGLGAHGDAHGAGGIGVWATGLYEHEMVKDTCLFTQVMVGPTGVRKSLSQAITAWLAGNPQILIDGYNGQTSSNPQNCSQTNYGTTCN